MKFVAILEHSADSQLVHRFHAAQRDYLRGLLDSGRSAATGPFAGEGGAIRVFHEGSAEEANDIVRSDPFRAAGTLASWQISPLA